jgi:hypothetical protein
MGVMSSTSKDRSQPLLRVPRDQTPVTLILDDGERTNAFLFVSPGTPVARAIAEAGPFVPVNYSDGTKLVARDSMACIIVSTMYAREAHDDLPTELQPVVVRLRSGHLVKGALRWTPYAGHRRVLDHLNDDSTHIVLQDNGLLSFVRKTHITLVEELPC